ncbi:MAG TPA: hypothetical protein VKN99_24050 [Polyangia bacterium]|nr:hypothetical protein [Polyangia bacterium]
MGATILRPYICPNCAAPLKIDAARDEVTCTYCGHTFQVRHARPAPAPPPTAPSPPAPMPAHVPSPTRRPRLAIGSFSTLITLAVVGFVLWRSGVLHMVGQQVGLSNLPGLGPPLQWDAVAGAPLIANVDGDGVEDLIGRVRVVNPDQLWVAAFAGIHFKPIWRAGPYGAWDTRKSILVALSGSRVLVTDSRQSARVLDLATGKELGMVPLNDQAALVCGAPEGAPRFYVETVDKQRLLIEAQPVQSRPGARPDWCGPGPFQLRPGQSECWEVGLHARLRSHCLPAREAPRVPGFEARFALREGALGVAVGSKRPGTEVPMVVGFDPERNAVQWNRVLPQDPTQAETGVPYLTELSHGGVYSFYKLKSLRGGRLVKIDAATGATRWDVIVPQSETGTAPETLAITERRVYVPHWTWLDVFDASTGAHLGTIGQF